MPYLQPKENKSPLHRWIPTIVVYYTSIYRQRIIRLTTEHESTTRRGHRRILGGFDTNAQKLLYDNRIRTTLHTFSSPLWWIGLSFLREIMANVNMSLVLMAFIHTIKASPSWFSSGFSNRLRPRCSSSTHASSTKHTCEVTKIYEYDVFIQGFFFTKQ